MAKSDVLRMRVSRQEKEAFEEAARIAGASFSTWARMQLRRAAIREFEDAGLRVDFEPRKEVSHGGRDRV